jgi:anti-sigma B factor antagonist
VRVVSNPIQEDAVDSARSAPTNQLPVEIRSDRERVVVAPEGELDLATAPTLERQVLELCALGFAAVCVDLRGLTFCDSSGLNLLLRLDEALRVAGCRFSIVDGDGPAARLLELTHVRDLFLVEAA